MLTAFAATLVISTLVILGMSLGYLVKCKSIRGSCGGTSSLGPEKVRDCPEPCDVYKKRLTRGVQRQQRRILQYPAVLRMLDLLFRFCRPGQAQSPPGIKRLRTRWRCACRVCCSGFVDRVRCQLPPDEIIA